MHQEYKSRIAIMPDEDFNAIDVTTLGILKVYDAELDKRARMKAAIQSKIEQRRYNISVGIAIAAIIVTLGIFMVG